MKRISLFSLSILFLLCLNSCKNFFTGSDFIMELEDSIEYNNLPVLNIELKSPPEKMGSISPTGNVSYKKKDSFEITFTKTQYCDFNGWAVLNGEELSDAIEFTVLSNDDNAGVYKAKATIKESIDNLVVIPTYTEHFFINEQFPDNPRLVYPANSVVELKFNYPISETANFKDYFTLKFADEDFSSYYEIRFSEDKKEVSLVPYAEDLVNYMKAKDISSLIMNFALSENFFTTVGEGDDAKEFPLVLDEKYKFTYMINTDVDSIKPTTTSFSAYRKYDDSYENELSVLSTTDLGANNHLKNTVKIKADFADDDSGVKYVLIRDTLTNTVDGTATNNTPTEEWTKISENFTDFEYELKASQNGLVKIEFAPVDYSGNRGEIQSFEVVRDVKTEISDLKVYNFELGEPRYIPPDYFFDNFVVFDKVRISSSEMLSSYYKDITEDAGFYLFKVTSENNSFTFSSENFSKENNYWSFDYPTTGIPFTLNISDHIGNAFEFQYIIPPKPKSESVYVDFGIPVNQCYVYSNDSWKLQQTGFSTNTNDKNRYLVQVTLTNQKIRSVADTFCSVDSDEINIIVNTDANKTQDFNVTVTYEKGEEGSSFFYIIYKLNNSEQLWNKYEAIWVTCAEGGGTNFFVFDKGSNICKTTRGVGYGVPTQYSPITAKFFGLVKDSATNEKEKQEIRLPNYTGNEPFSTFDTTKPQAQAWANYTLEYEVNGNGILITPFRNCLDTGTGVQKWYTWTNECNKKVLNPGRRATQDNSILYLPVNDFDGEKITLYLELVDGNNNSATFESTIEYKNAPAIAKSELEERDDNKIHVILATDQYGPQLFDKKVYLYKFEYDTANKSGNWVLKTTFQDKDSVFDNEEDPETNTFFYYYKFNNTGVGNALDNDSFYKIITSAKYETNGITYFSEPEYFKTFEYGLSIQEKTAYASNPKQFTINDSFLSGDNGVLVHSDYPVMLFTVATSKPYSECKDWDYNKWLHNRTTIGPELIEFTVGESAYKLYKTPLSEIQDGQCYVTFIYYAFQDRPVLTPVRQR